MKTGALKTFTLAELAHQTVSAGKTPARGLQPFRLVCIRVDLWFLTASLRLSAAPIRSEEVQSSTDHLFANNRTESSFWVAAPAARTPQRTILFDSDGRKGVSVRLNLTRPLPPPAFWACRDHPARRRCVCRMRRTRA